MSDKPIIFSAPMVRALLEGRKTQTRRIIKPQPTGISKAERIGGTSRSWRITPESNRCSVDFKSPDIGVGDRLYVREACATWGRGPEREPVEFPVASAADDPEWEGIKHDARTSKGDEWKIRPSIHMPRWASRLTLTVTDVRVQRLQEISEADAEAEGIERLISRRGFYDPTMSHGAVRFGHYFLSAREAFQALWNSLHGPEAWDANPWVAAYSFTVQHGNIDMLAERAAQ